MKKKRPIVIPPLNQEFSISYNRFKSDPKKYLVLLDNSGTGTEQYTLKCLMSGTTFTVEEKWFDPNETGRYIHL